MEGEPLINPPLKVLAGGLFIVAVTLIVFASPLYNGLAHCQTGLVPVVSAERAFSNSNRVEQDEQPQAKSKPLKESMPDEPGDVKIIPPSPVECKPDVQERIPPSVHPKKRDLLFHPLIVEAGDRNEVDPALIKAIIMAESRFNPRAVSRRGAKGLMQLMPRTAEALGVEDDFNPEDNINAGVRYLKLLMNEFNGDVKLALAAYNAGTRKVKEFQGIPPIRATQEYIRKVLEYYRFYKEQMAGETGRL
jgi:hypothetical protein